MVTCPYCGKAAVLTNSAEVYGHSYGMIWICRPCKAWVGTHKDGKNTPLGRLANAELRVWKKKAHAWFDNLWKAKIRRDHCGKTVARKAGYAWLAKQLGLDVDDCHIGMFDIDMCKRAIEACKPYYPGATAKVDKE